MRRGPLLAFAGVVTLALALLAALSPFLPGPVEAVAGQATVVALLGVLPARLLRPALAESCRPLGEWLASALLVASTLLVPALLLAAWRRPVLDPASFGLLAGALTLAAFIVPAWPDARRDERPRLLGLAAVGLLVLLPPWGEGLRFLVPAGAALAAFVLLLAYRGSKRVRDAPLYAFFAGVGATLLLAFGGLLLGDRAPGLAKAYFHALAPVAALLTLVLPAWLAERA